MTPLGEEVVGVDSRVEKENVVGVSVARSSVVSRCFLDSALNPPY